VQVHLVDGTYELFRAYFGAPSATSEDGREVGATRALIGSIHSMVRNEGATHIACAFDHVIESFRNELFGGYKTSAGVPLDLLSQFDLAERAVRALGMVVWSMVEFEADDALATGAARAALDSRVERVMICSPDKDLCQCVRGDHVILFDRLRKRAYDEAQVVEKFGVPPASIPDYLALVGDSADGIPGVPRWGARSAAAVLSRFGTIEAIPAAPRDWGVAPRGAASLSMELERHRQEARLFKTLATLRTDVPLAESVDDLEWTGAPRNELLALCAEIGERALPERVVRWRD